MLDLRRAGCRPEASRCRHSRHTPAAGGARPRDARTPAWPGTLPRWARHEEVVDRVRAPGRLMAKEEPRPAGATAPACGRLLPDTGCRWGPTAGTQRRAGPASVPRTG